MENLTSIRLGRILAVLLTFLALSGCGGGESTRNSASSSMAMASSAEAETVHESPMPQAGGAADYGKETSQMVVEPEEPEEAGEDMSAISGEAPTPVPVTPNLPNRKIIWRVDMSLETLEFDKALDSLESAAAGAGGYLESSSVQGRRMKAGPTNDENYYPSERFASLTARIPSENLESFLEQVGGLCHVERIDRQSEDITEKYTDTESRKRSLEVEQERLFALLEKADSLETIIALEQRLSEIRYQLDSFRTELRQYDSLVDYSTVTMYLREVDRITEAAPRTMAQRISSGFSGTLLDIKTGTQDFIVWFLVNIPYLLFWGVLITLLVFAVRFFIQKAERAAARAASNPRKPASQEENVPNAYTEDPQKNGKKP